MFVHHKAIEKIRYDPEMDQTGPRTGPAGVSARRNRRLASVGLAATAAPWIVAGLLDPAVLARLTVEDGPVETVGAAFFLLAALLMFIDWRRSGGAGRPRLHGLGALALLLLVCAGEEISWGQRIFGWKPPPVIAEHNLQGETNLHNLALFHPRNPDGTPKGFLPLLLNMNRLFALFWLVYCLLLPMAVPRSDGLRTLIQRLGIPIPPLWIGGLFLMSFIAPHLIEYLRQGPSLAGPLDEIKETAYAAIYVLLGLVFGGRTPAARLPSGTSDTA